jgi:hypothetical protein
MTEAWSNDELFRWFVLQQQQMVMIHLGKLVHPATSKIERDLEAAKFSIDLLGMLEGKTKGNLLPEDERLLGQVLATLRLNYVEEATRAPEKPDAAPEPGDRAENPAPDAEAAAPEPMPQGEESSSG